MYLSKTKFLIVGISRSGIAAAEFLLSKGAECYVCDELENQTVSASIAALCEKGAARVEACDAEAFVNKIDVLVLSPGIPIDNRIAIAAKRAGKRIIGEMELGYMYSTCPIVAVTGTNGKTTTCSMIADVLQKAGIDHRLVGNIGVPFTSKIKEMDVHTVAVTEVSSFQLETLNTFAPHVAVVTNISEDHMTRHYNMQNYVFLKSKLLSNLKESEFAVLNYDDYAVRGFAEKTKGRVIYFSLRERVSGVYVEDGMICYNGSAVMQASLIKLKGEHNLYNILAAVAACKALNIPDNVIAEAIIEFKGIKHRVEHVRTLNGVDFYNDSKATNVDSTIKAINTMTKPTVLILGGKDKGQSFEELFKRCKEGNVCKIVLFGETRYKMLKSAERIGVESFCVATNLVSAVTLAYAEAESGQSVLLSPACSSFDEFSGFEERGECFIKMVNSFD